MKREIFQRKYSNMPIAERFIGKPSIKDGFGFTYSPADLYHDIIKYENEIFEAKKQIELRLKWADIVLK